MTDGYWWRIEGGEKKGPYTAADITASLTLGKIDHRTEFWRDGMKIPKSLGDIPEFADAVRADREAKGLIAPWSRYWARSVDLAVFSLPLIVLMPFLMTLIRTPGFAWVLPVTVISAWLLTLVLDAMVYGRFGVTPGKWIFGLTIRTLDGGRPSFLVLLKRNLLIFVFGFGCFLPPVALLTMGLSYGAASRGAPCRWDRATGCNVQWKRVSPWRWVIVLGMPYLLPILFLAASGGKVFAGQKWTNPVTGVSTELPLIWRDVSLPDQRASKTYVFAAPLRGIILTHIAADGSDLAAQAEKARLNPHLGSFISDDTKIDDRGATYRELRFARLTEKAKYDVWHRIHRSGAGGFWTLTISVHIEENRGLKSAEAAAAVLTETLQWGEAEK
ncbi:RDD family protein [Lacibacterium aquatile]|uniref:RDD family protein n=1 Tax=Lacibacterium aquatile TaxID=1168082 RepID=A0ABW5DM69_9PROT